MIEAFHRTALLTLYHLSVAIGIALLPLAILARRGGITLPVHHVIDGIDRAYRKA